MSIVGIAAGPIVATSGSTSMGTQVVNPASQNFTAGIVPTYSAAGRNGEVLVSQVRGRYGEASANGNVFTTSVPAASALTIPHTLATLASKFCLLNPSGSGVDLEFLWMDYFINSATEVVNTIGLTRSTQTAAAVGTLTAGVVNNMNGTGASSKALFYVAATHADTPVWFMSTNVIDATTVSQRAPRFNFDGALCLKPGWCIDIVTSIADQANSIPQMIWAEWPTF